MTNKPWTYERYQSSAREGNAAVPGGTLRYRLAGPASSGATVVFESGWTAPFPYAVWLEEALASQVSVLSYDRAGVGDSRSTMPLTPQGITQQLISLLSNLGIRHPVVVVGHSYGGLIGALHATQAPAMVGAVVQIDPTPEFTNEFIDGSLRGLPLIARFLQLCALLKIDGPLFMNLANDLPPEIFVRIKRNPRWLLCSLNGAIAEIKLLAGIRQIIASSDAGKPCPRLVISGDPAQAPNTWLRKLLMNDEKARKYWDAVHELHQRQASLNQASRWMRLPYNHVSLITDRTSANEIASNILDFIR